MTAPKHRRPTRPDRLLLWAKDRLTLRRRPQPVPETADFREVLDGIQFAFDPLGTMQDDEERQWVEWMQQEGITTAREFVEVLCARHELDDVESVVGEWGQR